MAMTATHVCSTQEKLQRAREAAAKLALLSTREKNKILHLLADALKEKAGKILAANRMDI